MKKKTAAVYCVASDELLRTITRAGLMKLGYSVSFANPSLFNPLQAATTDHALAVVPALHKKCAEVVDHYQRQGKPVLLVGLPLFPDPTLVRVAAASSGWLPKLEGAAARRLKLIGDPQTSERQRVKNQPVLMLGQVPELALTSSHLRDWAVETLMTLRKLTDAPVIWRPHPHNFFQLPGVNEVSTADNETLEEALERCWLAVTHSAPTAYDALLSGMPVITEEDSMFADVTHRLNQFGKIRKGHAQDVLAPVFQRMSFIHWKREEISDGTALAQVLTCALGDSVPVDPPAASKPSEELEPEATEPVDEPVASSTATEQPADEESAPPKGVEPKAAKATTPKAGSRRSSRSKGRR